uniref:Uncharacterized protein n=1 Tax=Clytia hemisphaerica TaxID=252671 RepID=A0A7M5WLS9_9CNID
FFFNNGYSHNAVQYANGGFPGRATTQYTSVHHQSISHDDGDADGYVDGGAGYVGGAAAAVPAVSAGYVTGGAVPAAGYLGGASVVGSRYAGSGYLARSYHPRHVHVGVGTPGVKVEVETAKSVITSKPVHVTGQKMSEIKNIVKDVTASLAKTSKKLKSLKTGAKRQITPAFTPVVSEPVGVPSNRYPVPAADRYPLGAGYIWPSANYGHQYGGPYSWSKSHTPKAAPAVAAKPSTAKTSKKSNTKKSSEKAKRSVSVKTPTVVVAKKGVNKKGSKRQFIQRGYGGMPIYGMGGEGGEVMPSPRSFGYGGIRGYGSHHLMEGGFDGFGVPGGHMGYGHVGYGHHGGYPMSVLSNHGDFGAGYAGPLGGNFDAGHHEYGVEGDIGFGGHGYGAGLGGAGLGGAGLGGAGLGGAGLGGLGGHYGGRYAGHAGIFGGSFHHLGGPGIVGDYEGDRGALVMSDHAGFGAHGYGGPALLGGRVGFAGDHGYGYEGRAGLGYGHGFGGYGHGIGYGHAGVMDGHLGYGHTSFDAGVHGGLGLDIGAHGIEGHSGYGGMHGFVGLPHAAGAGFPGYARENIEQASEEQQQQQYAPSSRSMMPDPMYSNEQEQYAPESQYEMQQRMQPEYMSAKKSSVPKKANH